MSLYLFMVCLDSRQPSRTQRMLLFLLPLCFVSDCLSVWLDSLSTRLLTKLGMNLRAVFFDQELIHIATHLVNFCWSYQFKKAEGSVISNQNRMKFGRISLQVNIHQLTVWDFRFDATLSRWWPWHHFMLKSAAAWWVNMKSVQRLCGRVFRSLIYSMHSYLLDQELIPYRYSSCSSSCWANALQKQPKAINSLIVSWLDFGCDLQPIVVEC